MIIESISGCWFATDGNEAVWLADGEAEAMQRMKPAQWIGWLLRMRSLPGSEQAVVRRWASRLRR